ncbi:hypothetical protein XA68_10802 [Ophiocordyceps unilateralis]|uniref:RPEL repeat protein n=1 Tax=Ophiocordyceps unilateralis TaxID=268505 RepID=A0A2A9NY92_OPHUN|nr:hypothetical protein XA68_10802 [Ophiocordyceps unilateralis]
MAKAVTVNKNKKTTPPPTPISTFFPLHDCYYISQSHPSIYPPPSMPESPKQQLSPVDETPISPVRPDHARRNSLENHLMHRPNRAELVDKNILLASSAAPGLQAHQKELERNMLEDKLNDKISQRPDPGELIKEGVLQEDPRTADQKYEEAMEAEYAKREGGA